MSDDLTLHPAVCLARWHRQRLRERAALELIQQQQYSSSSPATTLRALSDSPEGQAFIRGRIAALRTSIADHDARHGFDYYQGRAMRVALALFLLLLLDSDEHLEDANTLLCEAIVEGTTTTSSSFSSSSSSSSSLSCGTASRIPRQWRAEQRVVRRLLDAKARRDQALKEANESTAWSSGVSARTSSSRQEAQREASKRRRRSRRGIVRPIPRVAAKSLSCEEFYESFVKPGIPCIISGGARIVFGECSESSSAGPRLHSRDSSPRGSESNDDRDRGVHRRQADEPPFDWRSSVWSSDPLMERLAVALRGKKARLKVRREASTSWARLEEESGDIGSKGHFEGADLETFLRCVASGAEALRASCCNGPQGEVLDQRNATAPTAAAMRYLHDWSLPTFAPRLAEGLVVPKWFAGDLLVGLGLFEGDFESSKDGKKLGASRGCETVAGAGRNHHTPLLELGREGRAAGEDGGGGDGGRFARAWPSLFVGPRGSRSDLHVDAFASSFWMAMRGGTKYWRLWHRNDSGLLYPRSSSFLGGGRDWVFDADALNPDPIKYPAAVLADCWEGLVEGSTSTGAEGKAEAKASAKLGGDDLVDKEGSTEEDGSGAADLLFVPFNSPHFVQNITDTVAVSCNYVDVHNLPETLTALDEEALASPSIAEPPRNALAKAAGAWRAVVGHCSSAVKKEADGRDEEGKGGRENPELRHVPYKEMTGGFSRRLASQQNERRNSGAPLEGGDDDDDDEGSLLGATERKR